MTVDPGSRGWNEHTHVTVERPTDSLIFTSDDTTEDLEPLLHIPAGSDSLCMHVPSGYAMISSSHGSHLSTNAYWNGTNWLRFNDASPASAWIATDNGGATMMSAAAGTGSISWGTPFSISAAGDVSARWISTSDGANGVISARNGDLYLRSASAGNAVRMDTATTLYAPGISSSGRFVNTVSHTSDIANTTGGTGPFEIGVTGGGAAMMAFHRHGYFAAHFGLDTDNAFKIGGWSMGATSARLLDTRDMSQTAAGNKLVQREGNGYILGNYINMTADRVESGAPAYVAGQNGDNYLRWYNKSLLVAPLTSVSAQGVSPRSTNWQRAATTWVNRTGYWFVFAMNHCHDTQYGGNSRNGVQVVINGADGGSTIFHGNTYGGQIGSWPIKTLWWA